MRNGVGGLRAPVGITVAIVAAIGLAVPASFAAPSHRAALRSRAHSHAQVHRRHHAARRRVSGRPRGIVRVVPPRARGRLAHAATTCAAPCLTYHGGPVLHGHAAYIIYWEPLPNPSGVQSFPNGYTDTINQYMADVAASSGSPNNVYSVATQYADDGGFTGYGVSYAPAQWLVDNDPLPPSGCSDSKFPPNTPCVTDAQIQTELDAFLQSQNPPLPRGLHAVYFLVTPSGIASCFDGTNAADCFGVSGTGYCAYHNDFQSSFPGNAETLYANMPFAPDVPGCQTGQTPPDYPNGSSHADDTISIISHEQIETMTDPLTSPAGWYSDASGSEIADLCYDRYDPQSNPTAASISFYNQSIGTHNYELQLEWSNAANGCAGSLSGPPPAPTVGLGPVGGPYYQSEPVGFSATSRPGMAYVWNFGDGTSGSSRDSTGAGVGTVGHSYRAPGSYTLTVQAVDPASNLKSTTASATVTVLAALPNAAFTLSPGAPTSGQAVTFDGRGSSDVHGGGIAIWQWSFGDGAVGFGPVQHHTYQAAGTFNVSLTVTNALGQSATTTQAVNVAPDAITLQRLCRDQVDQELRLQLAGFKANVSLAWLTSPARPQGSTAASKDAVLAYAISRVRGGEVLATVTGAEADPARVLKALKACAARCCGVPAQGCTGASRRLLATALQGLMKVAAKRKHGFAVTRTRRALPASCQASPVGVGQRLSVYVLTRGHRTGLIELQLS